MGKLLIVGRWIQSRLVCIHCKYISNNTCIVVLMVYNLIIRGLEMSMQLDIQQLLVIGVILGAVLIGVLICKWVERIINE